MAVLAFALSMSLTATSAAWADDSANAPKVSGANYYVENVGSIGPDEKIDVLAVSGAPDGEIYLTLKMDGRIVADHFKQPLSDAAGSEVAVVSLNVPNLTEANVDSFSVVAHNANGDQLYAGDLKPVYAQLGDGDSGSKQLIGVQTLASGESRTFSAPASLYCNNQRYVLKNAAGSEEDGVYQYEADSSGASAITGHVTYVDHEGNTLLSEEIANITTGSSKDYAVRSLIQKGSDGTSAYYRSLYPSNTIKVTYPGQTEFVITCMPVTFTAPDPSTNFYQAKIEYYDVTNGKVIMTDLVNVTKKHLYTVPAAFSQQAKLGEGHSVMMSYSLAPSSQQEATNLAYDVLTLDYPNATVKKPGDAVTYRVNYTAVNPEDTACVEYTLRFVNASQNADGALSLLKDDEKVSVLKTQGLVSHPVPESIEQDGVKYVPFAGNAVKLEFSTTANPVKNVYYVPEGYSVQDSYDITVNYVNVADGSVLSTESFTIDPTSREEVEIPCGPEKFTQTGITYVRLDGQSQPWFHAYFNPTRTYTVYYRDSRDTQYANTVIRRTVIREIAAPAAPADANADGTNAADGTAGAGDTTQVALAAQGDTLSAVDAGAGDGLLLNSDGVDTTTAREINDDTTPLGQFAAEQNQPEATGPSAPLIAGLVALAAVVVAAAVFFVLRSKRKNGSSEGSEGAA